jgi:hypothetical protein
MKHTYLVPGAQYYGRILHIVLRSCAYANEDAFLEGRRVWMQEWEGARRRVLAKDALGCGKGAGWWV